MSERAPLHTLPLFDVAPDIQTPAPSRPSATSEAAADAIQHSPFRRASLRRIMLFLASLDVDETRSMAEIGEVVGIPVHVMCARLDDLQFHKREPDGTRRSTGWVECVEAARASSAKPSLRVNGYRLTTAGRERVRRAQEPLR